MVRLYERERLINSLYSPYPGMSARLQLVLISVVALFPCGAGMNETSSVFPMRLSLATPICPASCKLGSVPRWE